MILYICDGKVPTCSGSFACMDDCYHTTNPEHAQYGVIEGKPEWYPERFFKEEGRCDEEDLWVEKKRR